MLNALLRRGVWSVVLVLIVSFLVFCLSLFLPGDAAATLAGESASPERVEEVRHNLGLDLPVHERYLDWLGDAVHGDLGRSLFTRRTVAQEIGDRWAVTVSLMLGAVAFSVVAGTLAGVWSGSNIGSRLDRLTTVGATLGVALPQFVLAVVLLIIFAVWLDVLPIAGYRAFGESPGDWARHLILPVVALAADMTAQLTRQIRSALSSTLGQDYIRTAYAKGLTRRRVIFKHGLRVAFSPAVAVVGVQVARMLGGAVIVEQLFSLPGLGTLTVNAILTRDLPVLQGIVPLAVLVAVGLNLLADVVLAMLNPRLRDAPAGAL